MSTPKGKPQARLQTEIPEQGVELLPIEAENPTPAAENSAILTEEIPEAAAVSNTRTSYVSDALPSAAVPTAAPAAVKASSIPVMPFGVAGGLLALGGFALAAKGSGSDSGKSDQAPIILPIKATTTAVIPRLPSLLPTTSAWCMATTASKSSPWTNGKTMYCMQAKS